VLGIFGQNFLISNLVFLATLIAVSSGYALLRKNLSEAAQALRAYHSPEATAKRPGIQMTTGQMPLSFIHIPSGLPAMTGKSHGAKKHLRKGNTDFVATFKHWLSISQTDGRIQAHSGAGQISWYDITAQLQDHETLWFASPVDG